MMDKQARTSVVAFTLNGTHAHAEPEPGERLSHTLRERLDRRDVKIGCNAGDCGACTVLVDGDPVCACLMPAGQAAGRTVETLAGLATDPASDRLQAQFLDRGAAQCGICTPGMLVSAVALLRAVPRPTDQQVKDALGGVLCRCTGYRAIIDAVVAAGQGTPVAEAPEGRIGDGVRRLDGAGKVAGTEHFGDDVAPPDTLVIRAIRSPHARAVFRFGDLDDWVAATPGVEAILTAADIPGRNVHGVIPPFADQPVFAEDEARFRGEAVAAVVGSPEVMARFDPAQFPVTWDPRDPVMDTEAALAVGAPLLHPGRDGNVMTGGFVTTGDPDAALARAAFTVTGRFTTAFVEHAYIEPEAGYAYLSDGQVVIHACTQAPVMDRDALEIILDRPADQIRIIPTGCGGGFGSKLDVSLQPFLALGAMKTGRPVRMAYSRTESMATTTKRHPGDMQVTIGATADGRLSGFRFAGDFNTGAYASWGPTVANRVPVHASGPYLMHDYRAEARAIHTHCPPSGAFRGFGVPQAAIAQELLFDELAEAVGHDPLEFRILNALGNGEPTVCGQVFEQGVGIRACLEALRPAWAEGLAATRTNGPVRRGVGVAAGWYGCGNTSLPNPSTIKAGIRADGTLVLHQGASDIGQGANTVIAQIFAEALGVPLAAVTIIGPDTGVTPDAGKTSASRQTFVTGNAAMRTGAALRAEILRRANAGADAAITLGPEIRVGDTHTIPLGTLTPDDEGYVLRAEETYDPPTRPLDANGQGAPYAQFGYAAHLAEIEVDMALGTVRPLRFVAAHDVGRAINPVLVEGQVQGGIAQGLGMALMEEYIPGRTDNLHDYLIPTIGDVPPIETIIVEEPDAHGPFGAKGLGEHALIPTAPALLNAMRRATGATLRQVPVTPSRLRAAILESGA